MARLSNQSSLRQTLSSGFARWEHCRLSWTPSLMLFLLLWVTITIQTIDATAAVSTFAKSDNNNNNNNNTQDQTCSWLDEECHFRTMTVDFGNGRPVETFRAYVTPDVSTFYQTTATTKSGSSSLLGKTRTLKAKNPKFQGLFGKFINLSPQEVRVMWDPLTPGQPHVYIADIDAFEAAGTATFPGHVFHVTLRSNPSKVLTTFHVVTNQSLYIYDPFDQQLSKAKAVLTRALFQLYQLQHDNLVFAQQYRQVTGREWLALYPRKHPPRYHMWPALYIGQTHSVTTTELPFLQVPPKPLQGLERNTMMAWAKEPNEQETKRALQLLQPYRGLPDSQWNNIFSNNATTAQGEESSPPQPTTWNLTVKVLSCAPRVFEISNFLSPAEVDHVMTLATGMTLAQSTTRAGRSGEERVDSSTRTSLNSWVSRETSLLVDALYRRAADVLQMDERLFRFRNEPHPLLTETEMPIAERLQLVHYDVGQQYTAHHDFAIPGLMDGQPSRFATMLFYLNDGMVGGETSFPRWLNAKTSKALKVKPKAGKAVFFYNVLPDGNYDERSQHAAEIVAKGEKWLTNLWVWDPYLEYGR